MKFKNRIKELMSERKVKQADLCRETNISTALMSNYVTGRVSPSLENAILIASALDVTLDELVGRVANVQLNEDEQEIIRKYRELNDEERGQVSSYLEFIHTKKILQRKSLDGAG